MEEYFHNPVGETHIKNAKEDYRSIKEIKEEKFESSL